MKRGTENENFKMKVSTKFSSNMELPNDII